MNEKLSQDLAALSSEQFWAWRRAREVAADALHQSGLIDYDNHSKALQVLSPLMALLAVAVKEDRTPEYGEFDSVREKKFDVPS